MERDGGGGRNPSEDLTFSEKKNRGDHTTPSLSAKGSPENAILIITTFSGRIKMLYIL